MAEHVDSVVELADLGRRLKELDRDKYRVVVDLVREIVEAQEEISAHDSLLILRSRRPGKRYLA